MIHFYTHLCINNKHCLCQSICMFLESKLYPSLQFIENHNGILGLQNLPQASILTAFLHLFIYFDWEEVNMVLITFHFKLLIIFNTWQCFILTTRHPLFQLPTFHFSSLYTPFCWTFSVYFHCPTFSRVWFWS